MTQEQWNAVDEYLAAALVRPDHALDAALRASREAGLPDIQVTPQQGKLLMLLATMMRASRILEIGTLGGYSTIWMARALPADGRLITLESEPSHVEIARANLMRAGLWDRVEIRLGRALDTLPQLDRQKIGPFDLIFIDADKPALPEYFTWSLKLSRPGSLIIVDNVIREGEVADASSRDASVRGVRRMFEMIAAEPRVSATAMQTVGSKGYDGLAFVLVRCD